jgi:hypothetical protein
MADIKLGLSGTEITLPQPQARYGSTPGMPVETIKQVERVTMQDGTTRYNTKSYHPRSFSPLVWEQLTAAELAPIETEVNRNVRLRYQNNYYSADWIWVRVTRFRKDIVYYLGTALYRAELEFEEEL